MRIKYLFLLAGLCWASNSATAFADTRDYILWGVGNDSCDKFVLEQAQKSNRFDMQLSWIAGFVSSANGELSAMMAKRNIESDLLKGADPGTLEKWLVNYCRDNGPKNLSSAANALVQSLLSAQPQPEIAPPPKKKKNPPRRRVRKLDPETVEDEVLGNRPLHDLVANPAR